jgi:2-dehydropantoate 2-reductase
LEYRKICIVGPGAIGGMMAVLLARAGHEVSALARAPKAEAITNRGLTLLMGGETFDADIKASAEAADLGPQDLLIVTLKGNGLPAMAPHLARLCGPRTPMVFAMNGVPWWFFDGFGGKLAGFKLASLDPDGVLASTIDPARIVWGVITCSVGERDDGVIVHTATQNLILGRPSDDPAGLEDIAAVFRPGGYVTTISANIRREIWTKLLVNVIVNPMSTLTHGALGELIAEPLLEEAVRAVAGEMRALGLVLGLDAGPDRFERLKNSTVKTSMLQDLERGRPLEMDSIIEATVDIAGRAGIAMPQARMLLGLLRLRAKTAGLM